LIGDILVAQQHELWPASERAGSPCSVIFYDSSKNQARVWHSISVCVGLISLRASRARRREKAAWQYRPRDPSLGGERH
jgi:hypothetical protein